MSTAAAARDGAPARPAASPITVTLVVMVGTFMTILDSTIANVALPHMQPSLGAAADSISWVLTSYIVAAAIATPLTGWAAARIGRRRLFIASVLTFTAASMLCGIAQSLEQMVLFRLVQGAAGAFLAPLGQGYVLDAWPKEKHGPAMAWWGVGIMIGPVLGPVIGGWLTDSFDWRWVFFINLPFGLACAAAALLLLPEGAAPRRALDVWGFTMLALGVGALQLCLDRGQQLDWFESWEVRLEAGAAIALLWMFGVHAATRPGALLDRRMATDRNFMTGSLFMALTGLLMNSTTALLPTMMQALYGYPVVTTGLMLMPRGFGMMATMWMAGQLVGRVDPRLLVGTGLGLSAISLWMMSGWAPDMGGEPFLAAGLVQGIGLGLVFVPLNTLAFATLAPDLRTDGSAFYMLLRNLGGSVGISLGVGVLARQVQVAHADLGAGLTPFSLPWADGSIAGALGGTGETLLALLDGSVNRQAAMIAHIDVFRMIFWITVAVLPLLVLLRRPGRGPAAGEAVHLAD